jgi:hypothetical protein
MPLLRCVLLFSQGKEYDAYEKDIAILQIYFKTGTIMEFQGTILQNSVSAEDFFLINVHPKILD